MKEQGYSGGEPKKELTREEVEKEVFDYLDERLGLNQGDEENILRMKTEAKKGNWGPALELVRQIYQHHYSESSRDPKLDEPGSEWTVKDHEYEAEKFGKWLDVLEK